MESPTTYKTAKRSKPPQSPKPQFQAIGVIEGKFVRFNGVPRLKTSDGTRLKLTGIDPKLGLWLLSNVETLSQSRLWLVYPQRNNWFFLKSCNPKESFDLKPDEFAITGNRADKNDIFVGRTDPSLKGNFEFISVENLPEGKPRSPISVIAQRQGDKLVFDRFRQAHEHKKELIMDTSN